MSARANDVLGPRDGLNTVEFDCLLHLPVQDRGFATVALNDASWQHRGRWNLSGLVRGLPVDIEYLKHTDMLEVIYNDKASETVRWIRSDRAGYQVEVHEGRFSAYTERAPRYPKGKALPRALDLDPLLNSDRRAALADWVARVLPDPDEGTRARLLVEMTGWCDAEVRNATNPLARRLADATDALESLQAGVRQLIADWAEGRAHDDTLRDIAKLVNAR